MNNNNLQSLCYKIGSGATPRGGKESYGTSGISLIRSQNVLDYTFSKDGLVYINEVQADQLKAVTVEDADVLINITGDSVARVCIAPNCVLPARVNQHVCIIRPNHNKLEPIYLMLYLIYKKNTLLQLASSGGTRNALTKNMIENFTVFYPEPTDQRFVIGKLLPILKKIEVNTSEICKHEDLIFAIYQNWFCDESVRTSWDTVLLSEVIKKITRKNSPLQAETTITISAKEGITSDYYTKRVASKDLSKYTVVEKGDFIYNRSSSDGYPVGVIRRLIEFERVALSPIYFCFRAKNNVSAKFLTYYFNSKDFTTSLYQIVGIGSRGHGMLNFSVNDFMRIDLALPPMALQKKFETLIAPIEEKISLLQKENKLLAELRDALLPKLMDGELLVEEGEA